MAIPLSVLGAVVIASVLGSLHCAGMCGGLVLFAVGTDGKLRKTMPLHVAYHAGRAVSYTALGIFAGSLGAAADIGGALAGTQHISAIAAGGAMILLGLIALSQNLGGGRLAPKLPKFVQRLAETAHKRALGLPPLHRAAAVGGLTPLLPCGWLYAFVIVAAGTGSVLWGGAVMTAFWFGTLPVMSAVGVGLQGLTGPLRSRLPAITSVIVIGLGVMTALGRAGLPSVVPAGVGVGTLDDRLESARSLSAEDLPCCNPEPTDETPTPEAVSDSP